MPEYLFTGTVELSGVLFTVTADNETEAKAKAKLGEWDDYDISGAETRNAELTVSSCELNE